MRPRFDFELWYPMYALGLIETLYFQHSNELEVVDTPSYFTDPGWIDYKDKRSGDSLFTVVKAK